MNTTIDLDLEEVFQDYTFYYFPHLDIDLSAYEASLWKVIRYYTWEKEWQGKLKLRAVGEAMKVIQIF